MGFPGGSNGKKCLQCARPGFDPWAGKIPWRRERLPTPVFVTEEFHGQRSLAGYSLWGCKESDTTEQVTFSLSFIGCFKKDEMQVSELTSLVHFKYFDLYIFQEHHLYEVRHNLYGQGSHTLSASILTTFMLTGKLGWRKNFISIKKLF